MVRGAVLTDPSTGLLLGLRHREVVPGRPAFPGFDLLSFGVASPDALTALVERFDALGVEHSPLFDRGPGGGVQLDVPDPDGTVIRFLSPFGDHPPFLGLEFHRDGRPRPTTVLVCWPLWVAGSSSQALGGCMTSIEEIFRLVGHHTARS